MADIFGNPTKPSNKKNQSEYKTDIFGNPTSIFKPQKPFYTPEPTLTPLQKILKSKPIQQGKTITKTLNQNKTTAERITGIIPKPILKQINSDSAIFNLGKYNNVLKALDKVLPQGIKDEKTRYKKRLIDSVTLGISGEADKALGKDVSYRDGRSFKDNKLGAVLDFTSTTAGYLVPGLGYVKGLKLLGMGAKTIPKLGKGATKLEKLKRNSKVALEQAKEGAIAGAAIGASEVGVREAINPDDYSAKQNLKKITQEALLGTVLDPLAYAGIKGAGLAASKVISKLKKAPEVEEVVENINSLKNLDEVKTEIKDVTSGKKTVEQVVQTLAPRTLLPKTLNQKFSSIRFGEKSVPDDVDKKFQIEQDNFRNKFLSDEQKTKIEEIKQEAKTMKKIFRESPVYNNQEKQSELKGLGMRESADIRKVTQGDFLIKVPGGLTDKELNQKIKSFLSIRPNDKVNFDGKEATVKSAAFGKVTLVFKDNTTATIPYNSVSKELQLTKKINEQTKKVNKLIKDSKVKTILKTEAQKKLRISKSDFRRIGQKGLNELEVITPKKKTEREKNKEFFDEVDKNQNTPDATILAEKPIRGQSVTVKTNLKDSVEDAAKKFQSNFIDELNPIERMDKDIHLYKTDTFRANNLTNESLEGKNQLDLNGNTVGDSLNRIIESSGNPKQFEKYVFYRQAISRAEKGDLVFSKEKIIQDGLTPEKMKKIVLELEKSNPKFIEAGKKWNGYHANIRKMMLDENNWTSEYVKNLEEAYPNYAAFFRVMDGNSTIKINQGLKQGGSEREVLDIFTSTAEITRLYYNFMLHNRANRELLKKIRENPELYKEQGISEVSSKKIDEENVDSEFINDLVDFENSLQTKSIEKGTNVTKPNEIFAFENGEKIKIKIEDPEIYQAFASVPEQTRGMLLKTFEFLTKSTKRAATGVFAPIWSTKGLVMDTTRSLLNAENPIMHLGLLVKSTMDSFTKGGKNLKNLADNYYNAGGGFSGALRTTPEARYSSLGLKGTGIKGVALRGVRVINPFDRRSFLSQTQDFFENLNRIAAFEYKKQQLTGGTRELTPKEVAICLKYAREITTDYTVKGRISKKLEAGFAYTTASIAGTTQLLKSVNKNKMKSAALIGLGVITPKLIEYAQFKDDKDYQALPNREKYRNIIYGKTEDGKFLKLPLDPGLSVIGEMFSRSLQAYEQKNKSAFNGAMEEVLNSYAPPPVQGVLKAFTSGDGVAGGVRGLGMASSLSPFVTVATNKTFTGAPVESLEYQLSPLRPGLRYNEKTSKIARKIGEITNFSPMKVDYLLKNYGGDFARILLPLNSDVGSINSEDFLKNFMSDPTFSNNLAIQFYKGREKLKSANAELKEFGKEPPKWYNEKLYKSVISQANDSVTKKLSYYNQLKRKTSIDKNLTASQRKEKIKKIQRAMNETYLDWNILMKKYGVPLE